MSFKHLSWIFLCLCCAASPAKAQTLHVISVADICDFDLGTGFGVNQITWKRRQNILRPLQD